MTGFAPIAIVGLSCVLPGALRPRELWEHVLAGTDLLSRCPPGHWRLPQDSWLGHSADGVGRISSDRGGYVRGFDGVFDPASFGIPAGELVGLDPLFHWVLWGSREALRDAGHDCDRPAGRAGLILGNLGYPSASMTRFAESVWLQTPSPDARNRFHLELPPLLAARILNLDLGGFSIDAACASSLYAIKLSCDRLHDGRADLMVAGGVNRADDLFLHAGFTALSALSPSGRSLPFHRQADGLVPSEGAAFVVLKRLQDAIAADDKIHAVIRGVGLGNDGRSAGLLVPAEAGQVRTMMSAYAMAGLRPSDISLVECHATGTPVGDAVEIRSMSRVFQDTEGLVIGSLKSNLGHLITASGAAALLKVVEAMRARTLPPTRNSEDPTDALKASPFRVLAAPEPWCGDAPRRAAISNFGFGGNNAHLILEEWTESPVSQCGTSTQVSQCMTRERRLAPFAIVGLGVTAGGGTGTQDFVRTVLGGESQVRDLGDGRRGAALETITLPLEDTRFPPRDLEQTLPQQLLLLKAAEEAMTDAGDLIGIRTGVFVGIEVDAEITRHGVRWRLAELMRQKGACPPQEWLDTARATLAPPLEGPARIIGNMPNMPANRLNSQFDMTGPGFTIGAGKMSGAVALDVAVRALRAGEIDAALVCAVDLSCSPVHERAMAERDSASPCVPGDAAVVLVLRRLEEAQRAGSPIVAILDGENAGSCPVGFGVETENGLRPLLGEPFAASDLLQVAAAAICCRRGSLVASSDHLLRPWLPDAVSCSAEVSLPLPHAPEATVVLRQSDAAAPQGFLGGPAPHLYGYSGETRAEVLESLRGGRESGSGPARLVIVAADEDELAERRDRAQRLLRASPAEAGRLAGRGVHFYESPITGDLAFVFTGAAAAYPGMGRDLVVAVPRLAQALGKRCHHLHSLGESVYGRPQDRTLTAEEQLRGSSLLCQLHAELTLGLLGLSPNAVLGLSSGETNSLLATGAWRDIDRLFEEVHASGMYDRELAGQYDVARRAWGLPANERVEWSNMRVLASAHRIREALANEPRVHLLIIHAPGDCLIGGESEACDRVLKKLGSPPAYASHGQVVHCPEMAEFAATWRTLHTRATENIPGIRFYSNAICDSYIPSDAAVADMLLDQAQNTVDFSRTVEKAWDDGVRIFVEHGPRSLCSDWIGKSLAGRPHLAVSLDRAGCSSLEQVCDTVGCLVAAGVPFQHQAFFELLKYASHPSKRPSSGRTLTFPAHPPHIDLPPLRESRSVPPLASQVPLPEVPAVQKMAPAPLLPFEMSDHADFVVEEEVIQTRSDYVLAGAYEKSSAQPMQLLASAISGAHQEALSAQVQVLRMSLDSRLQTLRSLRTGARIPCSVSPLPRARAHELPDLNLIGKAPAIPVELRESAAPPLRDLPAAATSNAPRPSGPRFSREQLQEHASGEISTIFGPLFRQQDGFVRQVRMPEPPLLLADRVTGMTGEPGSMGVGSIWTETDIRQDSWFVRDGHIPLGILIEAGQADLFLISWLGVDFLNRDQRKYRMLSCDVTFFGSLPKVGDTLCYDIHIDHHANVGDVRLFFFHFDCRVNGEVRLRMRGGQAGFFSDQELAESAGVLWTPDGEKEDASARYDAPVIPPRATFSRQNVQSLAEGRAWECFGPGYELAATHSCPPRIADGDLMLIQEIAELDPRGGPWKRGYLRVVNRVSPDDWYFRGHFKNDPCMPGTLMAEAGMQAMAFYLAALGFTLEHDGWRFEPVMNEEFPLRCRGQVTPTSRVLTYELFVREVIAAPLPTLYADILGTVDGVRAIHGRRMGLRLVPDWPTEGRVEIRGDDLIDRRPAAMVNGFRFGAASMRACSLGRPSDAFGEMYRRFDGPTRVARLPAPPYNFISRISRVEGEQGGMRLPASAEAEYDIPQDAWYFCENPAAVMPLCALMEAALQPCGWLASYLGCASSAQEELFFRNLDGTASVHGEIGPQDGALTTHSRLVSLSRSAGITLVSFEVECRIGERLIFEMKTGFGFFPKQSLAAQAGLPASSEEGGRKREPSDFQVNLQERPARYFSGSAHLPEGSLLMLDRITDWWPQAGSARLGRLRAEKDVDPSEWFFKAHFFQDPVQPGTLGIEAMIQLLQFFLLHQGLDQGLKEPHFEPLALDCELSWKYRGQVLPQHRRITTEVEIREVNRQTDCVSVMADAWLWVDGMRIYQVRGLAVRLASRPATDRQFSREYTLDPDQDTWIRDHCPNYVTPALPLMEVANRLAQAGLQTGGRRFVTRLRDVQMADWIAVDKPQTFRATASNLGSEILAQLAVEKPDPSGATIFHPVAKALVTVADEYPAAPEPLAPLTGLYDIEDPYQSGSLFHGRAFQVLRSLQFGDRGATAALDASVSVVPIGLLNTALLDGAYHAIPNDNLHCWMPEISQDQMAFPCRLSHLTLHGPTPTSGRVRCEVRLDGFDGGPRFPAFRIQLSIDGSIWADIRAVHILVPKGPIGRVSAEKRRAFLRDRTYVDGVGLSTTSDGTTELAIDDVAISDWLRGSIASLYQAEGGLRSLACQVAIKKHIARKVRAHPAAITVADEGESAVAATQPLTRYPVKAGIEPGKVSVVDSGEPELDLLHIRNYWVERSQTTPPPALEKFLFNLCRQFVESFVVTNPESLRPWRGSPVLFLANHQTLLEPGVFLALSPLITGTPIVALAKVQQRDSLLVQTLLAAGRIFTGLPELPIVYFDRSDPGSLLAIAQYIKKMMMEEQRSALVNVEGIRSLSCRTPVKTVSAVLLDLAAEIHVPIVPVRLTGGLPILPAPGRLDFPIGYGKQQYILGPAILPEELASLNLLDKKARVLSAINGLGPSNDHEVPSPPDLEFQARVTRRVEETGVSETESVLLECAGLSYDSRISELLAVVTQSTPE